ncbi:hypothetical protein EDB86DRAFT_3242136, partial [Lactarius hatsudake]
MLSPSMILSAPSESVPPLRPFPFHYGLCCEANSCLSLRLVVRLPTPTTLGAISVRRPRPTGQPNGPEEPLQHGWQCWCRWGWCWCMGALSCRATRGGRVVPCCAWQAVREAAETEEDAENGVPPRVPLLQEVECYRVYGQRGWVEVCRATSCTVCTAWPIGPCSGGRKGTGYGWFI